MDSEPSVFERINDARSSKLAKLDLNRKSPSSLERIVEFPSEIFALTQLEVLSLRDNEITSIPAELVRLRNLKILDLSGNELTEIPDFIADPERVNDFETQGRFYLVSFCRGFLPHLVSVC
jgi:Leucine-rich repeat (LRR) protein